jgi:L-asparaginase II
MATINSGGILVEVVRNNLVESVHSGHLAILDSDGKSILEIGDQDFLVYPRSAIKAIQASAMVRHGLSLDDELLALVCASHAGSQIHQANALKILAVGGLTETALANTPDKPLGISERKEWGEKKPTSLAANCSGKHAGMVVTAAVNGWDVGSYKEPNHPLQVACREELEILSGEKISTIAVDGCGAPLFALSFSGLVKAIHQLMVSEDPIHQRVTNACRKYPEMVSGAGRLPTVAMQKVNGLFVKDGAEGVMVAGLESGETIAWKMSDGSQRGAGALLSAALEHLGIVMDFERENVMGGGQVVGEIRASKLVRYVE